MSVRAPVAPQVPAAVVPLLRVRGLRVELGGQPVLLGIDLDVRAGEVVGLVGPNGAGKSTLIRAATGVVPSEGGDIAVSGTELGTLSRSDLARRIAVVQQLPEAPATMRVGELALLGRSPYLGLLGRESRRDERICWEAMRRAGCEDLADRPLGTLSGGQRRRAFVARALAQECPLLLLDEPTANLDPDAQSALCELLRELAAGGTGVLVVLHDLTLAAAYCDRIVLLDGGLVVASGTAADVLTTANVRRVYGRHLQVLAHPASGAPMIVPTALGTGTGGAGAGGAGAGDEGADDGRR